MTRLGLRPYQRGDDPPPGSVPVSVIVLTLNEEVNILRCLESVAWADQVIVVDSGSTDKTLLLARSMGTEVVEQPWLGFSAQREHALRLTMLRHNWVYFVDADEWVSPQLAAEIAVKLANPPCAGYAQCFRLVFLGTWIRHCGWYGSRIVRLIDRRFAKYDGTWVARAHVDGPVERLYNDLVDEDLKGLAVWLHKHVRYAELEYERRGDTPSLRERMRALRRGRGSRPFFFSILRDLVFPGIPAKPVGLFLYMYIVRLGFLDGMAGLRFCFLHAWYELVVASLRAEARSDPGPSYEGVPQGQPAGPAASIGVPDRADGTAHGDFEGDDFADQVAMP
jgi:glycosyltransferase involved in cell wall biosynthesis